MPTALVANGEFLATPSLIQRIRSFNRLIAVDGGLNYCHRFNLTPEKIIGDFDSVDPSILTFFPTTPKKIYSKDKDQTDLQIALEEVLKEENEVVIFAALGGRIDHTLSNVNLLSRYPGKVSIETEKQRLFVIDRSVILSCFLQQTISLFPLNGPVKDIVTSGLKWELNHATLDKHFIGISNIALKEEVFISVKEGDLLCCLFSSIEGPF